MSTGAMPHKALHLRLPVEWNFWPCPRLERAGWTLLACVGKSRSFHTSAMRSCRIRVCLEIATSFYLRVTVCVCMCAHTCACSCALMFTPKHFLNKQDPSAEERHVTSYLVLALCWFANLPCIFGSYPRSSCLSTVPPHCADTL